MEGLQVPENRYSEDKYSADVKDHGHLRFAKTVKHTKNGLDIAFTEAKPANIVIEKNVTFEI